MSELLPVGIHFGIDQKVYRSDPGVNYSSISQFIKADSPKQFKYERDNPPEVDPDYIRIGSAIDCLIWDAEQFSIKFAICPEVYPCEPTKKDPRTEKPWNWGAAYCDQWRENVVKAGLSYLTVEEKERVKGLVAECEANEDIKSIIEHSERQAIIICNHPVHGFRMKCAVDLWPKTHSGVFGTHMWDFKSEGQSAHPDKWSDKAEKCGYQFQAAHYSRCAREIGFPIERFGFCVVESNPPHDSKIHYFNWSSNDIQESLVKFDEAALRYIKCLSEDKWPGLSRDWNELKLRKRWRRPEGEVLS